MSDVTTEDLAKAVEKLFDCDCGCGCDAVDLVRANADQIATALRMPPNAQLEHVRAICRDSIAYYTPGGQKTNVNHWMPIGVARRLLREIGDDPSAALAASAPGGTGTNT